MKKLFIIFFAAHMLMGCSCAKKPCATKHCKDFKTRKEAQEYYEKNKDCNKDLDRDHDGKVCESLPEE